MKQINNQKNPSVWRSLALYGSMSLNLGIMALGGYFLGGLLEKQFAWKNAAVFGVLIGILLGLYEMMILIMKSYKTK